MTTDESSIDDMALDVWLDFLNRSQRTDEHAFEALCRLHPAIAPSLAALQRAQFARGKAGEAKPLPERLRALAQPISRGNRFHREEVIARGGMGVVHRVRDVELDRTLALKEMRVRDGARYDLAAARFLEEAHITAGLDHPGIVPVHEVGVDSTGGLYFAMKLVQGRDLRAIFASVQSGEDGWSRTRALGVLLKVCEAMAYAHSKGVIHRDLKPDNVMVGRFGEVYVMDWGLGRALGRNDLHDIRPQTDTPTEALSTRRSQEREKMAGSMIVTMDGDVLGTPAYMSPEHARGEAMAVSPRSDVYSVGAILYHLLSGEVPYLPSGARLSAHTVLARVVEGPPRRLHEFDGTMPTELIAICERAMARDASRRYPSMLELGGDIRAYLEGRVVQAYETGAWAEARKWVERNKLLAATFLGALLVLVAGLTLSLFLARRASERRREAEAARADVELALVAKNDALLVARAMRKEAEARRLLADSAAVLPANPGLALLLAIEGAERAPGVEARTALVNALARSRERRTLLATSPVIHARLGSDNRTIVTVSAKGWQVWDSRSGEEVVGLAGHSKLSQAALSPDGMRVVTATTDGTICVWSVESSPRELLRLNYDKGPVKSLQFDSTGSRILAAYASASVWVLDSRDGKTIHSSRQYEALTGVKPLSRASFSPDCTKVVATWQLFSAWILDLVTGELLELEGDSAPVTDARFAADGSVVTIARDGMCRAWNASTGLQVKSVACQDKSDFWKETESIVSIDGAWIATFSKSDYYPSTEPPTVQIWSAATGQPLCSLRGHDRAIRHAEFGPDGSALVTTSLDATARVWELARSDQDGAVVLPVGFVESVVLSRDGKLAATLSGNRYPRITVWDDHWKFLGTIGDPGLGFLSVAFSGDGQFLVTACRDDTVRVWEVASGDLREVFRVSGVVSAAFSPGDEQVLAVEQYSQTVSVIDRMSGLSKRISGHADQQVDRVTPLELVPPRADVQGAVSFATFSPEGTRILTVSGLDRTARLWDSESGKQVLRMPWLPVDLPSMDRAMPLVGSAGFAPDGLRVVIAEGLNARIWDTRSAEVVGVLKGHQRPVHTAAFSHDGRRIVTSSADGTVRTWDAGTFEQESVLAGHGAAVSSAVFTPDSQWVLSVSRWDRTARLWPVEPLALARQRVPRELTPQERDRYRAWEEE